MSTTPTVDGSPQVQVHSPMERRLFPLPEGWPLCWLLVGFPVFWALGLSAFAVTIMAVPMAISLIRSPEPIRFPKGFGFWALFLLWSVAGLLLLQVNPRGMVPDTAAGRVIAYATRELSYLSVTVVLLYVGNLSKAKVSQAKLMRWLAVFFVWAAAGGVLGMLAPTFSFTSPFEQLLPSSISGNSYVQRLVHPAFAQVQELINDATPRPAAPFPYTNTWGFHLTILGVWFVAAFLASKTTVPYKVMGCLVGLAGFVTLVFSLNRAAWIGVAVVVAYVAIRLAIRGRIVALISIGLVAVCAIGLVYVSPLKGVIDARLDNGKSDNIRAYTTIEALKLAATSPIVGYGSTRTAYGSADSIAVGKSADCPNCGNPSIGINGYTYFLMVSTGYVGTALFFGLWVVQIWRARRLHSPPAVAGSAVLILSAFYGFFYDASLWMMVPFVSVGVLWRESEVRGA